LGQQGRGQSGPAQGHHRCPQVEADIRAEPPAAGQAAQSKQQQNKQQQNKQQQNKQQQNKQQIDEQIQSGADE
jgi:hypothetical protein